MEIKRLNRSVPVPEMKEISETPATSEKMLGISGIPDSWENVNKQYMVSQEMIQNSSPTGGQRSASLTEQAELTKLLEQKRFFQTGSPNIKITMTQTGSLNTKYPDEILNLAQILQKSPAEIVALFKKHGLDPANLPNPPDRSLSELFNDPDFDSTLNGMKSKLQASYQNYKNEIAYQTSKANSINASNIASDKSVIDDLNTAPFEYLHNAKNGANTPEGQAWLQEREAIGKRTAKLLSTLYPGAVVNSNPAAGNWEDSSQGSTLSGFIEFNGQAFNAVPNSSTGAIQFGNAAAKMDYPAVQLVPWEYDAYGDGAVSIPDWMQKANYPTHAYDNPWNQP